MVPLKKILKSSSLMKSQADSEEREIESLLMRMFRDLPQDKRQIVFDILTDLYCLEKKKAL